MASSDAIDFDLTRRRVLTPAATEPAKGGKCVVYWMSRDQRADDNWALLYACKVAQDAGGLPVRVCFSLVPKFLEATIRMYGFMLGGLEETEGRLRKKAIPFSLLEGFPENTVPEFAKRVGAAAVVTDMSPLKTPTQWAAKVAAGIESTCGGQVPMYQVDAHNVVPVWVASPKQEYAARTIRPKITSHLPRYFTEFPPLPTNPGDIALDAPIDWSAVRAGLTVDTSVPEVTWLKPGHTAGMAKLQEFVDTRLKIFDTKRNDPNVVACSDMSPYTHFGQVSAHRAALFVRKNGRSHSKATAAYIEESIVRRELSDNFCFYNANYDTIDGISEWARESLLLHAADKREHLYTLPQFETGKTHDKLWNAAQLQMVHEGKMHGFLRMYWAKKILEWSESPQEALRIALLLNNKYELDGRDPNGYVGCMWSICGIHDMGWKERPIFGKIRFMNYKGCLRKFKVAEFEARYPSASATGQKSIEAIFTGGARAAAKVKREPPSAAATGKGAKKAAPSRASGGGGGAVRKTVPEPIPKKQRSGRGGFAKAKAKTKAARTSGAGQTKQAGSSAAKRIKTEN